MLSVQQAQQAAARLESQTKPELESEITNVAPVEGAQRKVIPGTKENQIDGSLP
jgi:hypothetical protein